MSQAGQQTVTLSYTESDITVTTTYSITVNELPSDYLEGTYVLNYDSTVKWKLFFNRDGTGVYKKVNSSGTELGSDTFSYSLDGVSVTFSNVTATCNAWGNYHLTSGTAYNVRSTTNSGTVVGDEIHITTYSTNGNVTRAAVYSLV